MAAFVCLCLWMKKGVKIQIKTCLMIFKISKLFLKLILITDWSAILFFDETMHPVISSTFFSREIAAGIILIFSIFKSISIAYNHIAENLWKNETKPRKEENKKLPYLDERPHASPQRRHQNYHILIPLPLQKHIKRLTNINQSNDDRIAVKTFITTNKQW